MALSWQRTLAFLYREAVWYNIATYHRGSG
jgi:hypothetical protein